MSAIPAPAWWTDADQAELDVIVNKLVEATLAHRECARCRERPAWCPPMEAAFEAVLNWLRARRLLSRAEYLRARQKAGVRHTA